jgi:hypothetical protein
MPVRRARAVQMNPDQRGAFMHAHNSLILFAWRKRLSCVCAALVLGVMLAACDAGEKQQKPKVQAAAAALADAATDV